MNCELLVHPDEITEGLIDRFAAAGISTLGIHPVGGKTAADSLASLLRDLSEERLPALLDYAHEKGLSIEYEFHSASYLLPRSLFDTHPEYFRMDEAGERNPDCNFCVSSEEALAIYGENAVKVAKALYRSSPNYYFWLDDRKDRQCHCERCRGLSSSEKQLKVINAVARKLRELRSDAKIAYLAYFECVQVPEKVTPEDNVFLEYAPFEKYVYKGEDRAEVIERERISALPLLDFFGRENSKVLEYWYDNSMFSGWKKPPKEFILDRVAMEKEISEYRDMGFEYMSSFACYLGDDYNALYGEADFEPFGECCAEHNAKC